VFRQRAASEGLIVTLERRRPPPPSSWLEEAKWRRVVKEQSITAE
jgi:hypothetical protein